VVRQFTGNKFNPNPQATVYYGDQTWEEMHFPSYGVVVDDITLAQKDVVAAGGFVGGGARRRRHDNR
jgi:hypothetical protein